MHFHSPAEHTIDGVGYSAEMHIVHQSYETDKLVVIGIVFDDSKDIENTFIEKLNLTSLVLSKNNTYDAKQMIKNLTIPIQQYVTRIPRSFYYYNGSLTTPPCKEGVTFI